MRKLSVRFARPWVSCPWGSRIGGLNWIPMSWPLMLLNVVVASWWLAALVKGGWGWKLWLLLSRMRKSSVRDSGHWPVLWDRRPAPLPGETWGQMGTPCGGRERQELQKVYPKNLARSFRIYRHQEDGSRGSHQGIQPGRQSGTGDCGRWQPMSRSVIALEWENPFQRWEVVLVLFDGRPFGLTGECGDGWVGPEWHLL